MLFTHKKSFRLNTLFAISSIFLITFIAYIPAMKAGFIWDDDAFLTNNPLIQASDGLYRFWFTTEAPDYFPVVSTSLWLEWRIWGMNASGYHVINVLLHATSATLLWILLKQLKIPGSLAAALFFAIHPVNTESVAWITERKNTLTMVFFLLTFIAFYNFESKKNRGWYFLSLFIFLISLLCKTATVTLPCILLLIRLWQNRKISAKFFLDVVPFFFLSFIMGLVTLWFQNNKAIGNEIIRDDSFFSRIATSGKAIWFYIYKALIPVNLSFVYPRWNLAPLSLGSFLYFFLLILTFSLLWIKRESWGRAIFFGLLYFVITLLPVLGFFDIYFMKFSFVADHWQYFSIVGIIVPITALMSRLYNSLYQNGRLLLCFFMCAGFLVLTTLTFNQCKIYYDGITLYTDIILKNPSCWMAYNNRGQLYEKKNLNKEAMTDFSQAIKIKEDYYEAYFNRGILFEKTGKPDLAIFDYTKSLTVNPSYYNAFYNRGLLFAKAEKIDLAISDFINVIRLNPKFHEAYSNRGVLYGVKGKFEEALVDLNISIQMNPNNIKAYINRGFIYGRKGDYELAILDFNKAIKMDPYEKIAYINRSFALENQNKRKEALRDCLKAAELGYPVEGGCIVKLNKLARES